MRPPTFHAARTSCRPFARNGGKVAGRRGGRIAVFLVLGVVAGAAGLFLLLRPGQRMEAPAEEAVVSGRPASNGDLVARWREELRTRPDDPRLHEQLAAALASSGDVERALHHFREVVRIAPDAASAHFNLGNTLVRLERLDEAVVAYRRALQLQPEYASAHQNLAAALKELGQLAAAHRHLNEASRLKRSAAGLRSGEVAVANRERAIADSGLPELTTPRLDSERAAGERLLDPQMDGWESEEVAEEARLQLKRMVALLGPQGSLDPRLLEEIAAADVSSGDLRPPGLTEVFRDATVVVRRGSASASSAERSRAGREGLAAALDGLTVPFASASSLKPHVKVVRVALAGAEVETTVTYDASARMDGGAVQQRSTWQCVWSRGGPGLRLTSIRTTDHEEVEVRGARWLADCTSAVLGGNASFQEQLLPGLHHWLSRVGRVRNLHIFARFGIAVGDVNGDDREDVYVCQGGGLPNRLYVQQADGTAVDRSAQAGVDWLEHTSSALLVDLDNDGDQDLVAATILGLVIAENDSTGVFRRRAVLPPIDIDLHGVSAADFDGDGDLDLYICIDFSVAASAGQGTVGFLYHDANDGGANRLFRNDVRSGGGGDEWTFTDVTAEVGLDQDNRRHSLAAAWDDYDNDGDPDLYVANDYGQNCLYRNDGGRFVNVAREAGVVDFGSGMSVSWGDYNRDGWMDLYVANMFSTAGNRVTRQEQFQPGVPEATRALYQRFAKGNSLFENRGDGTFVEVGARAAVEMGRWAWSSMFADVNNDGWEDLLVANGYITTEDSGDL